MLYNDIWNVFRVEAAPSKAKKTRSIGIKPFYSHTSSSFKTKKKNTEVNCLLKCSKKGNQNRKGPCIPNASECFWSRIMQKERCVINSKNIFKNLKIYQNTQIITATQNSVFVVTLMTTVCLLQEQSFSITLKPQWLNIHNKF